MNKKHSYRIFCATALIDVCSIVAAFILAYLFRFSGILSTPQGIPSFFSYSQSLLGIVPVYLWFLRSYRLYEQTRQIRRIEEIFVIVKAISFAILILMAITFLYREFSYSRIFLLGLWFFSLLTVSAGRYLLIQWEYHRKKTKKEISKLLIIGINRNARYFIQWAKNNSHYGYEPVGVLGNDSDATGTHLEGVAILGTADMWETFIKEIKPDLVVLLDPDFSREQIMELVVSCEDKMIEFKVGADFYGLLSRNIGVEYISNIPLLGFRSLPLDDVWNRISKRTFDIVISGILMLISMPIWFVIMIISKTQEKGPVFFTQERVGRDGKSFQVIKFRTMKINAEKETGPVWAKENDGRTTKLGRFLRRWNFDELPQLWNVFRGEMSLVGPRPERPEFVNQFRETIPRYMARHKIKSGLTGWAQVHGLRGNTSIQERIKYDLYYMENWSLLLDFEILIMTLFAFKNAY